MPPCATARVPSASAFKGAENSSDKKIAAANAAINAAVRDKSVIDSLAVVGLVARGSTPEELGLSLREQYDRWGPLVKRIGFTADS